MSGHKESAGGRQRKRTTTAEREHRIASAPAQKMVRKTRELIAERGIAAANIREIAQACRQSVAAPLWYFGSKGRLLIEVLRYDHAQRIAGAAREGGTRADAGGAGGRAARRR